MDNRVFGVLEEAAKELNLPQDIDRLQNMQKVYDEGLYFASFIGNFSSGKSSLINNIIGRKILPQGTVETTPILTYIRYGLDEKAVLFFNDGSQKDIALEDVSGIMQKGSNSDFDVNDLEHMEIFLNQDLFANGLILMDTPGLNTIIKRHERLLMTSLALSSKIVYVTGGAVSKIDAEKLAMITKQGFNISYVRTHCDEIRESEEGLDDVIKTDKDLLSEYGLNSDQCFHVSNVEGTSCYDNIDRLKAELTVIGEDAKHSLEMDTKSQLKVFADDYLEQLKKIESVLAAKKSNNDAELTKQQENLSKKIQILQKSIEDYREKLNSKIDDAQKELRKDMDLYIDRSLSNAERSIKNSNIKSIDASAMDSFAKNLTNKMLQDLFTRFNDHMDPMIAEINGTLSAKNLKIESVELPDAENYADIVEEDNAELDELRDKISAINAKKENLEQMIDKLSPAEVEEIKRVMMEAQNGIIEAKQKYSSLGAYVPRMVEVQQNGAKASDIGRNIGNVLDWITIIMPQGALVKAVKGVGLLPKIAKTVGTVEKTLGIAQKSTGIANTVRNFLGMSKTYQTVRRTQKAVKLLNTVQNTVQAGSQALKSAPVETSFLDYLSLAHWGEKLGGMFDAPPMMTVDKEYERAYMESKHQIEAEIKEQQALAYKKKCELGIYEDERERRAAKIQSLTADAAEVERQLKHKKAQIKAESQKKALAKWKADCAEWYRNSIESELRKLVDDYLSEIPSRMENYQDRRSNMLMNKLNSEQAEYDKLMNIPPGETEEKLNKTMALMQNVSAVQAALK